MMDTRPIRTSLLVSMLAASLIAGCEESPPMAPTNDAPPDAVELSKKPDRPFGDVLFLAHVASPPGFPEGVAVRGNRAFVSAPAMFGTAGQPPSAIFAYDLRTGELVRTYPLSGEDLSQEHATSGIAFDGQGRLYVSNSQLGVIRLDLGSGDQESYVAWPPDIPNCTASSLATCSPTSVDRPTLIADIAFDPAGNMYATDLWQATIWRLPPGGIEWEAWFQDPRLDTFVLGPNGIRLSPDGTRVFFVVTFDPQFLGQIYSVPRVDHPTDDQLELFHTYVDEIPDGIAFGRSGLLYVALKKAGLGVSILRPDGSQAALLDNATEPLSPYDAPANIAFNHKGSIVVTNHAAFTGRPESFGLLDVFVDDKEAPLPKPLVP